MKILTHLIIILWYLLCANTSFAYTKQDTLRGTNGIGRKWWDVQYYNLSVDIDTATKSIDGLNVITFKVNGFPIEFMQIDLQDSLLAFIFFSYGSITMRENKTPRINPKLITYFI